jgi:hypothetical protein
MNKTSDKVISDYLNNMFMDLTISEPDVITNVCTEYVPLDSTQTGFQLVPCMDPFQFMNLEHSISPSKIWLAYLMILNLARTLPFGPLKKYCLQQCQILINQFNQQSCH